MYDKMPVLETNHLNKLLKTINTIKQTRLSTKINENEFKSTSSMKKVVKKEAPNEMYAQYCKTNF